MQKILLYIKKYFVLAGLIAVFVGLLVKYFQLKHFVHEDHRAELEQYYKLGEWARPEIAKHFTDINQDTVVALGSSSMIVPGTCDGSVVSPRTFVELFNNRLHKNHIHVLNLSTCGEDSKGIYGTVDFILNHKRPRAFLFYIGQSDYTNSFRDLIHKKTVLINSHILFDELLFFLPVEIKFKMDFMIKNNVESALIKMYRTFDQELFNTKEYDAFSKLITIHLNVTLQRTIDRCRSEHVPLILITPVSNLLYGPVAGDENVISLYKKGIDENDPSLLIKAADQDFFGFDQRVKSYTRDIIIDKRAPDILTVDLWPSFVRTDLAFYKKHFGDIFHFTEEGHEWVFSELIKNGAESFVINSH